MAVELLETLEETITAYTGLSPATFFTVIALALAVYYAVSGMFGDSSDHHQQQRSVSSQEDVQPLPPPVQLGEISEEELKAYDGKDPEKPLLMAIKSQIYDVSQSRMFYGPGGPYALFAGKDASRALAKMSFEERDLNGDLSGLGAFELEALQDWEYKFMSKYVKVGSIKKPETAPEASSADEPAESTTTHESDATPTAESSAPPPAESTAPQSAVSSAAQPAESTAPQPAVSTATQPAESTAPQPALSTATQPAEPTAVADVPKPAKDIPLEKPTAVADVPKPAKDIPSENGVAKTKEENATAVEAKKGE